MKITKLTLSVILSFFVYFTNAQYWNIKTGDTLYYESPVIIGNNYGENAMLSLFSQCDNTGGGGIGLLSRHSTNSSYLQFSAQSRIGSSSNWSSQSQGTSFWGELYLSRDNASSIPSSSSCGLFILDFDNYSPYDNSLNTHYLGGSINILKGSISSYPNNSAIGAVIGRDKINNEKTYAGYFEGKGYFSDNVGFGTKEPSAKIEVANGDIYLSDISSGIIMKSPDGSCWRGVLNNSGQLIFTQITSPEESSIPSNIVTPKTEKLSQLTIYPNPSHDEITLSIEGYSFERLKYSIIDGNGQIIHSDYFVPESSNIDVSYLNTGIYVLKVIDENNTLIAVDKLVIL
jgi:hypothetical protein